jgi:hypothetical protein
MTANTGRIAAVATMSILLTAGCLIKEERHTWYLEPDSNAVTWVVLEQDIRSNAKTAPERAVEELDFWNEVQGDRHETARMFRALNAAEVRTRVLRSRTPFGVQTAGIFPAIAALGQAVLTLDSVSTQASSTLERDGLASEWVWTIPAEWLDGEFPLRIVLVAGHFETATGFTLSADHRVATLEPREEDPAGAKMRVVKLRWTTVRQRP